MTTSNKFLAMVLSTFLFSACGGGSNEDPAPPDPVTKSGLMTKTDAERVAAAIMNGYIGMLDAQTYPMVLVIGDLISSSSTTSNPHDCLTSGTYTLDFVDSDGSGAISAGESSDVSFDNCYGATSAPVNGSIHQDLINFDADFSDASIIATNIRRWNAHYNYNNFSRNDISSSELTRFNGDFTFDYQIQNAQNFTGWTLDTGTKDLRYTNSLGSVLLKDLAIAYTYDEGMDTLTAIFSGSIEDALGPVTIEGDITTTGYSTTTPSMSGTLEVTSQLSFLLISISDNFTFDLSLDSEDDGAYDFTWQYTPAPQTTAFEGIWDVYGGNPGPNNEVVEFSGNAISYRDDSMEYFSGTFVDTSDLSANRMQITVASSTNTSSVGKTGNCIYQFSMSGGALTLACNDPGISGYPQDFTPATGVLILDLVKQ